MMSYQEIFKTYAEEVQKAMVDMIANSSEAAAEFGKALIEDILGVDDAE